MGHTFRYQMNPDAPKATPQEFHTYGRDGVWERWMVYYASLVVKYYGRERLLNILSNLHATFRKDW